MFHEIFDSLGVTPIVHPYKNSKFEVLLTLFDPPHFLKNIRNYWCTKKTKR